MDIKDFLAPTDAMADLRASDKSQLLKVLSAHAAASLDLEADLIADAILKREDLGSTGMGGGVAIPHARIESLQKPFGLVARLREPIEFEAVDDQPVDVVFLLLLPAGPEAGQLSALASVSRKLRDEEALRSIRSASGNGALHAAMVT